MSSITNFKIYFAEFVLNKVSKNANNSTSVTVVSSKTSWSMAASNTYAFSTSIYNPYLKCSPNPVDNELVISYIDPLENVEIYDITGKRVFKQKYESNSITVDFSRFSPGTYMVKVITAQGSQFIKIIKK